MKPAVALGLSLIALLNAAAQTVVGQDSLPFLGTWSLDTEEIEEQFRQAGMAQEQIAMRVARLRQMKWIFAETQLTTLRDGFPDSRSWQLVEGNDGTFKLQFRRDDKEEQATIVMDGPRKLKLDFPGTGSPGFKLTKVSSVSRYEQPSPLKIGDKAPPLQVAHWVVGQELENNYQPGQCYLVEFWATWCPPCVKGMSELARLRTEFAKDRMSIMAISNEPAELVKTFLQRKSPEDQSRTLLDHVSQIAIGADPDGSTFADYMVAAELRVIPTAFIVGASGQVEWIGRADQAAKVLKQVVAGSWDRAAFARRFAGQQKVYTTLPQITSLMAAGKQQQALKLIDELLPLADERMRQQLQRLREQLQADGKSLPESDQRASNLR